MKLMITMKDPDCNIEEEETGMTLDVHNLPIKAERLFNKFFEYQEYLLIELDTEKGTVIVLPNRTGDTE